MHLMTEPIQQRTPEWFQYRLGKVTGSRVADVTARTKSGWGAARGHYLMQLVVERLTGDRTERFVNAAMEWGTNTEPYARIAYTECTGNDVVEVGCVDHPSIPTSLASPDGLVYHDGLVEIKCPMTETHISTILGEGIAPKYMQQMQWQMACTGRKWCDFVSFDPRLPGELRIYVERVARDDAAIASLERDVRTFLAEVDTQLDLLALAVGLGAGHDWISSRTLTMEGFAA
jgi:putative phage-type endonuclease